MTSAAKPNVNMDLMVGMGAQALSVYDETGLTPRQLAEQRDELYRVLKKCRADMALLPASLAYDYSHFPAMDALIAKVEAKP